MKRIFVAFLVLSSIVATGQHAVPSYPHVPYDEGTNNWLNLYLAESKSPTPVVIWAHANGTNPSANDFPSELWQSLKSAGISVISWESVPQILSPEHIAIGEKDFLTMMKWVAKNSKKYNLDTTKIIISGRSRGSIISFAGANQLYKKIRGVYLIQALPNGGWRVKDFRNDITENSPTMVMAFAEALGSKDGHTPDNGLKIEQKYKELGIGEKFRLYHSLGKDNLYQYLVQFVQQQTEQQ